MTPRPIPAGMSPSPFLEAEFNITEKPDAFVRMNLFPSTLNGHLLFIPKDISMHTPFQMSDAALRDTLSLMKDAPKAFRQSLAPENRAESYTIGWNVGAAGGQSIAHAHAHIYGRKAGDTIAPDGSVMEVRGGIAQVLSPKDAFYDSKQTQSLETLPRTPVLMENNLAVVIASPHPVAPNHVLILPKREVDDYHALTVDEQLAMVRLSQRWLVEQHGLDVNDGGGKQGANIGWNVGREAGQTYTSSAVMEVIPRTLGDVEKPRGGIAKIKPPADAAYYRGEKTGVQKAADGSFVTADLEADKHAYYKVITERMRRLWPSEPVRQVG